MEYNDIMTLLHRVVDRGGGITIGLSQFDKSGLKFCFSSLIKIIVFKLYSFSSAAAQYKIVVIHN